MDNVAQMDTGFEGYPNDYVTHNLPLVVLSGLCPTPRPDDASRFPPAYEGPGTEIESELPLVAVKRADLLLEQFRSCEKSDEQWNSKPIQGKSTLMGFKFRTIGRVGQVPGGCRLLNTVLNKSRTLHSLPIKPVLPQKLSE
jgi:hypothetical protein